MRPTLRIVFMGTPDFAVPTLTALVEAGHQVVAVYTQPPRPAGRGKQPQASAVQRAAEAWGIAVRCPSSLKRAEEQTAFAALGADIAVVAAYGLILPRGVLDAPKLGCLNVHASLLPRWRGAAPIQRAILAGDATTGVTIMRMEAGLDTGPMLACEAVPVAGKTAGEVTAELAEIGARLMVEVLVDWPAEVPQPDLGVTYAPKVDKAGTRLDFTASAEQAERQIRAFAPSPGAWFELEGERFRVLAAEVLPREGGDLGQPGASLPVAPACAGVRAGTVLDQRLTIACGQGALRPLRIQRAGRPVMDVADLLRGRVVAVGTSVA